MVMVKGKFIYSFDGISLWVFMWYRKTNCFHWYILERKGWLIEVNIVTLPSNYIQLIKTNYKRFFTFGSYIKATCIMVPFCFMIDHTILITSGTTVNYFLTIGYRGNHPSKRYGPIWILIAPIVGWVHRRQDV